MTAGCLSFSTEVTDLDLEFRVQHASLAVRAFVGDGRRQFRQECQI